MIPVTTSNEKNFLLFLSNRMAIFALLFYGFIDHDRFAAREFKLRVALPAVHVLMRVVQLKPRLFVVVET